jgi:hypothetical protein
MLSTSGNKNNNWDPKLYISTTLAVSQNIITNLPSLFLYSELRGFMWN